MAKAEYFKYQETVSVSDRDLEILLGKTAGELKASLPTLDTWGVLQLIQRGGLTVKLQRTSYGGRITIMPVMKSTDPKGRQLALSTDDQSACLYCVVGALLALTKYSTLMDRLSALGETHEEDGDIQF